MQFSSPSRPAVCTLASISLPSCIDQDGSFDFQRLQDIVRVVVTNTDKCIDVSDYPTPKLQTLLVAPVPLVWVSKV